MGVIKQATVDGLYWKCSVAYSLEKGKKEENGNIVDVL